MPTKMMDEIIHHCTRCKMDLNHRVILLKDDKPKRVLCLTCQTERVYKAPKEEKKKRAPSLKKRMAGQAAISAKQQQEEWIEKINNPQTTPKNYKFEGLYAVNDLLSHPTFGLGVVIRLIDPDKIEVFFGESVKIFKCGKFS